MRTLAKLAYPAGHAPRSPLFDVLDHVKRALASKPERRVLRPLQDLDSWSDQSEVAYYESCQSSRCL